MTHEAKIHEAQTKILRELLFLPDANFAKLVEASELEGDHAKFHIKRLAELGYIVKRQNGNYTLSVKGKEYANKLDTDTGVIERQPKSACICILYNEQSDLYLIQERLKNPYYGYWGFYTGKIRWGEKIAETAVRETEEETGFTTKVESWEHRGILHELVKNKSTGEIIEDKIFHMMYCKKFSGQLTENFEGGRNFWMDRETVLKNPKVFKGWDRKMNAADGNIGFVENVDEYEEGEF